ncbi:Cro/Cl family transcriptional regulator [Paenibacillus selenitireducens]|uniref:Cro/Cl family transcriptional regulator n=1 Tax=Paenibacillus selenitireducens TaxID=1324314 RepID=A0A1T2XA89_9BACL|nr:helix-turn-helix transcriptional regulator [Paenibacillus selenitireducens]OPA76722.1 Cro/Cl family transcriptional regulator [Paenibacillus selenitireducens]
MIKVHLSRIMGEKKLKISDLANITGLHRNGITKLYNDKTDGIKFDTLDKICVALDCSVNDLIEHIPDKPNDK